MPEPQDVTAASADGEQSPAKGFAGLRVVSFESRRAQEMAKLIATYGGHPIVSPSLREVPRDSNTEAVEFARELAAGNYDMVIFLTGVGTRALARAVETVCSPEELAAALRRVNVVARGPKPFAALKELGVPVALRVPEPNTWRELLGSLDEFRESLPLAGRRVAIQEYGIPNPELLAGLSARGAILTRVPVYEWALPEDPAPLRAAIGAISRSEVDVVLFTTAVQVVHAFQVAEEMGLEQAVRDAWPRMLVGSIGPTTTEALLARGLDPDLESSRPKMGYLVMEAAQCCAEVYRQKQAPDTCVARPKQSGGD